MILKPSILSKFVKANINTHRRTEGGGDGPSPPPFWDILLRISQKQLIFLNIRPPPFWVSLYAPDPVHLHIMFT